MPTVDRKKGLNIRVNLISHSIIILVLFFIVVLILFIATKPLHILSQKNYLEKSTNKILQHIEANTFTSTNQVLNTLSGVREIKDAISLSKKNKETGIALEVARNFLNASIVYIMDTSGNVLASTEFLNDEGDSASLEGNNYAFRPYFKRALNGERVVYPAVGITTGVRGIYCSSPIRKGDTTIGVVVIKLSMDYIDTVLNKLDDKVLLFSPDNIVFATNETDWLYGVPDELFDSTIHIVKKSQQFNLDDLKPLPFLVNYIEKQATIDHKNFLIEHGEIVSSSWYMIMLSEVDPDFPLDKHLIKNIIITFSLVVVLMLIIAILLLIINRKKRIEKRIRQHRENLNITLQSIGEGVIATNIDGIIKEINPAALKLTGYAIDEAVGEELTRIFKIFIPKTRVPVTNFTGMLGLSKSIKAEDSSWLLFSKDGSSYDISLTLTYIKSDSGENVGLVLVFRDITQQKETKSKLKIQFDQLKEALKRAEESDKLKTAFLQNISHEIRTPLNGIIGFSELLSTPELSKTETAQYTNYIVNSSKQLLEIIQDVIEVSKLEIRQVMVNKVNLDINEVMQALYNQFHDLYSNTDINFELLLGNHQPLFIDTDQEKVRKVLYNLLVNAFKFTSLGKISFGYVSKEDHIEFFVQDSGIGISREQYDLIFKLFTQASSKAYEVSKGIGLGLTLAQKYVNLLGGSIWVESEIGNGSTFYFTIATK